jgi:hypothetical protein
MYRSCSSFPSHHFIKKSPTSHYFIKNYYFLYTIKFYQKLAISGKITGLLPDEYERNFDLASLDLMFRLEIVKKAEISIIEAKSGDKKIAKIQKLFK